MPLRSTSAAPLQPVVGGLVKIAVAAILALVGLNVLAGAAVAALAATGLGPAWASLIVVLLGIPVGTHTGRKGVMPAIAASLGMLAGYLTRPHAVGPEGVRIRQSTDLEIALTWDDVLSVARRKEVRHKGPKFTPGWSDDAWVLHLPMQDETNLAVELERPIEVAMPAKAGR